MSFQVREHYQAGYYQPQVDRYLNKTRFSKWRLRNVFQLLGDPAGRRVVDLGCGMGTFSVEVCLRGGHATGIDPAETALRQAVRLAGTVNAATATFVAADAAALPLATDSVDAVICADLTEHLDEETLAATLRETARVLKPGGRLALYTPSPTHLLEQLKARNLLIKQDPSHIGLRSMEDVSVAIRAAGMLVERAYYRPTHIPVYNVVERVLGLVPVVGRLFRRRICIAAKAQ